VAAKALLVAKDWPLREKFVSSLKQKLAQSPLRYAYYPGAIQRYNTFLQKYSTQAEKIGSTEKEGQGYLPWAIIRNVPVADKEYACQNEPFAPLIAEVALPASHPVEFMKQADAFCADKNKLWGNLSAVVIASPDILKQFTPEVEKLIENLKYGTVALNIWSAIGFALGVTTWGAYPGNSLRDIQSGRGTVHNTFLFDYPEKSVIRAPFKLMLGLPLPYMPRHKNKAGLTAAIIHFEAAQSLWSLGRVMYNGIKS